MLLRSNVRRGRQLPLLFAYAVEDTYTARFGQTPPPWPLAVLLGPAEENTRYHYYVLSVLRLRLRALCRLVASFLLGQLLLPFDYCHLGSHYGVNGFHVYWMCLRPLSPFTTGIQVFHLSHLAVNVISAFHPSRPISSWHFDRYIVFLLLGMPCEAPRGAACFWESKDFLVPLTVSRVV